MASVKTKSTEKHHSLSGQVTSRQLKYTESMISTFNNFTSPFFYERATYIDKIYDGKKHQGGHEAAG